MREDWKEVNSGDILDIRDGTHDTPKYVDEKAYPLITSKNLKDGKITFTNIKYISEKDFIEISKRSKVDINDVLFAMIGTIGNPVLINKIPNFAIKNVGLFKNKINAIESKLLAYFLDSLTFKNQLEKRQLLKGTTQKFIPLGHLRNLHLPLPPLLEQKAIVAKIEQLFSELDKGIESLKTAQAKLKIYRQAVLKKAFEGELTKEWREKQTNLPTAEELLQQIKEEQKRWLNQEIKQGNSEAKRINKKIQEYEVKKPNKRLPATWAWSSFLESCKIVVDCHNKTAPYSNSGAYLVRTSNVRNGKLDLENDIRFVDESTYEYWSRRCPPVSHDILFTREAPMGEAAIIPTNTKICMGQRMMLLRVFRHLLSEKYLLYTILDSTFQERLGKSAIGTGVKHLRVGDVENLVFPLCSLEEQNQIVQEIESRLSVCDNIEKTISDALVKAEALRQSILKKAFEGKLLHVKELEAIKSHSEYESAEKLLQRIKLERAK